MAKDVSLAPNYDFVRLCHYSRLIQMICLALQMALVYSDFSNLSYFQIIFYESLSAAAFYVVFNRWSKDIDGRFDLESLTNPKNDIQKKVPYAIAFFAPVILGFLIWSVVGLENGFASLIYTLGSIVNFFSALGLMALEIYEVFVHKAKST